jgi:hypothetical protein
VRPEKAVYGADGEPAELDLPISLIPPEPIVPPLNELTMNYMKTHFKEGRKYG